MYKKPPQCPGCSVKEGKWYKKKGYFKTKHNHQPVPRYECKDCGKLFSSHTFSETYRQHKPQLNQQIFKLISSGVTLRRTAKILGVSKNIIAPKVALIAQVARVAHLEAIKAGELTTGFIQFDEMETFEHTHLKPLSIALAVRAKTGQILDIKVAEMNAKGHIAETSRRIYGLREDTRKEACQTVMETVKACSKEEVTVACDGKKVYPKIISSILPSAKIKTSSRKNDDHLWRLNHTAAKLRADLTRLHRRTWSTTKKREKLEEHLHLYIAYNNGYELKI